ncbi:MAG: S1C family serine protease [Aeoliella sp.]
MSITDQEYEQDDTSPRYDEPVSEVRRERHSGSSLRMPLLLALLGLLLVLLLGPHMVARFRYADTRAKMLAEVDAATEGLPKIKQNLNDLVLASRLVVKRASPSVVSIHHATMRGPNREGSGVIVDEAGYIVTNFHVVANATGLHVRLADGRTADAGIVGGDSKIDLAVLKINMPDLVAAEWGNSDALEVGDLVWALGSPFGLERTVTFGIVSAKQRRAASGVADNVYQELLQTDAAVNPGNSGGPLVDLEGRVVGINVKIVGNTYQGVSFAIPSQLARETYNKMREEGWIERGYLGVEPQPVEDAIRRRLQLEQGEGVLVARVSQLTPASRAGFRQRDVIVKWNNHFATDPFLLTQTIADTPVGSKARVIIKRLVRNEPVEMELEVTVGAVPRL